MKKRILGLFTALTLCLCLLPAGAAAENEIMVNTDLVDEDGNITTDTGYGRRGVAYSGSETDDTIDDSNWHVIQADVTVKGDLTLGGGGGLVLAAGATLTVNGTLILKDNSSFHIYGKTATDTETGKLIIKNENGVGAAIRSDSTGMLTISSGKLEISGTSGELVKNVKLDVSNTKKQDHNSCTVMKATRTDASGTTELKYEEWAGLAADKTDLKGSKLVIEYCDHPSTMDDDGRFLNFGYNQKESDKHQEYCKLCGFTWAEVDCFTDTTLYDIKQNGADGHTFECRCGREKTAEHELVDLKKPAATLDGKGHTTKACKDCGYSSGDGEPHDYNETGECKVCDFLPVFEDRKGNLYGFDGTYSIKALNEAIANGVTDLKLVNFAKGEGADTTTVWAAFELNTDAAVTLDMNGKTLTYDGGASTLTVSKGTLTVTNSAEEGAITITQTGKNQETVKSAIKVTGGELIFEDDLIAIGGKWSNTVASAIEVTGGTVTFEGEVTAEAQKIDTAQSSGYTLSPAIKVEGGEVTFENKLTATGGIFKDGTNLSKQEPAVYATSGTLDFKGNLDLNGGLKLTGNAVLKNKLTQGTFWTEVSGSRLSVEGANPRLYITDLLADGYAFAEKDTGTVTGGGSYKFWSICDLTIVKHTHEWALDKNSSNLHSCGCGASEGHNWNGGECGDCHYKCPHPADSVYDVVGQPGVWVCQTCKTQMLVESTASDGTKTYGTDFKTAMNAATDGTKITLLADVDNSGKYACITGDGVTVTLDLNGHTIREGWIHVGWGETWSGAHTSSTLKITGDGSYILSGISGTLSVSYKATLDLSGWTSGEITRVEISKQDGNEGELVVSGDMKGTIGSLGFLNWPTAGIKTKLTGGTYGEIKITPNFNGGEPFSSMLAKGYAFQYTAGEHNGKFVEYKEKAEYTGVQTIENVKVVKCPHSGMEPGEDGTATCAYCNATGKFVASVDGDLYTDWDEAFDAWLGDGEVDDNGILKLYTDYTATVDKATWIVSYRPNNNTLDLNGHKMSVSGGGAFVPANNMSLTIKDTSEKKTGKITSIFVDRTDSQCLTLESGRIDSLTVQNCNPVSFVLKGGSVGSLEVKDYKTNGIMLKGGSLGAYTLPAGTVLADIMEYNNYYATGTSLENRADTATTEAGFVIKTAPEGLDFAPGTKAAAVPLGGEIPFAVTPTDSGLAGVYKVTWFRRTDTTAVPMMDNKVTGVDASEKPLDVFCVITGLSNGSGNPKVLWQMSFKGYQLTVQPANISAAVVTLNETSFEYDRAEKAPTVSKVELNGITLTEGKDYTVDTITPRTDAGNYTLTITAVDDSNYTGTAEATWTITPKIVEATVTVNGGPFTYSNGETIEPTVTVKDGDTEISASEYTVSYQNNINAGTATVIITDKDGGNYTVSGSTTFEIGKADAPTDVPDGTLTVYNRSAQTYEIDLLSLLPERTAPCTYGAIIGGTVEVALNDYYKPTEAVSATETTEAVPASKAEIKDGKLILPIQSVNSSTTGEIGNVKLKVTTTNYQDIDLTIVVSAANKPSSGGGSGSTKTETTTNPDGSVTKTETKSDGTVIETTTGKDGSTTRTETKPDGSSVTERKDASGSTGTVKTDKNGGTEADAKISDKAIEDTKKSGEAVKVPVEVKAGESSNSAPTVKIDLPGNAGATKIEIPVDGVTPGTVAVIVHPDGTEEIVTGCTVTENGVQLTVDGDTTVKILDNSRKFIDTENHWAEGYIDFVSARGLLSGTGKNIFSPNSSTTRAQLWTILARRAGVDPTGGATWYEKGQLWAVGNGISDGTSPDSSITRAQMVTMLWRAAGSPEAQSTSSFTDVPADSYYALAAAWAAENGITAGVGGGRFDPNATCTRAQIAVFLWAMAQK